MPPESSPEELKTEQETSFLETEAGSVSEADAKTPAADTSTADTEDAKTEGPKTAMEAVEAAMKSEDPDESSTSKEVDEKAESEKAPDAAKEEGSPSEKADGEGDDDADVPKEFHEHPAWKRIIGQRDESKAQLAELQPRAEAYDSMVNAVSEAGLSGEEFNTGFQIMNLMKNDPLKALEQLTPYVTALQQMAGEVLPDDLQANVDSGEITETLARELARTRGEKESLAVRSEREREAVAAQQQQDQTQQVQSAVNALRTQWAESDVDFAKKEPFIMSRVRELLDSQGMPETPDKALELVKQAKTEVESSLRSMIPERTPETPVRDGGAPPSTTQRPTTPQEVVDMVLSGSA